MGRSRRQPERRVADDELAAEHEQVGRADLLVGQVLGAFLAQKPNACRCSRSPPAGRPRGSCRSRRRSCRSGAAGCRAPTSGRGAARARPSKPSASHAGWAARARSASSRTSSADRIGTSPTTAPVAGFSTVMVAVASSPPTRGSTAAISPRTRPSRSSPARSGGRPVRQQALEGVDDLHPGGHLASTVCLPSSHGAASVVTMKNWEPLVFSPRLAIASAPRTTLCWLNSSSKS